MGLEMAKETIKKALECSKAPHTVCTDMGCKKCRLYVSTREQHEALEALGILEVLDYRDKSPDVRERNQRELGHYMTAMQSAIQ